MFFEIRDYHYRPGIFDAYRAWAEEAVPVLRSKMDVLGFWIDAGLAPEVTGTDPIESGEWQAVWSRHPDPNSYLQMSARFMESM